MNRFLKKPISSNSQFGNPNHGSRTEIYHDLAQHHFPPTKSSRLNKSINISLRVDRSARLCPDLVVRLDRADARRRFYRYPFLWVSGYHDSLRQYPPPHSITRRNRIKSYMRPKSPDEKWCCYLQRACLQPFYTYSGLLLTRIRMFCPS